MCKALGLMQLAHFALLWSISFAHIYALNKITFTYYTTSIPHLITYYAMRLK
jgi:hypothetical protein